MSHAHHVGISPEDASQRLRAARAFADIPQADVADHLKVSTVTVKRMERGSRNVTLDELFTVADLCGVPRSFMIEGFSAFVSHARGDEDQAVYLREAIGALNARFDALEERLSRSAAEEMANAAVEGISTKPKKGRQAHART